MKSLIEYARGSWQRSVTRELQEHKRILNPGSEANFRGLASRWVLQYRRSWRNLLTRLLAAGYKITYHPGPRGGAYLATYTLDD